MEVCQPELTVSGASPARFDYMVREKISQYFPHKTNIGIGFISVITYNRDIQNCSLEQKKHMLVLNTIFWYEDKEYIEEF